MTMHYGWTGRILKADLRHRTIEVITPGREIYESFIGGRGLAGYYLRPFCTLPWDSPDMPLLLFTGPLAGTDSPASGMMTVMSVSPLTNTIGDSSAGGRFGTELKRAGWDGIIITGCSASLCGIKITGSGITFTDAADLKGRPVSEIFASLPSGGATAATGFAAENGVLFANISFEGDSFGERHGLGLVMNSKGLKYIYVEAGDDTPVFDGEELASAREDIERLTSASPVLKGELGISEFGTGALYDLIQSRRMMPAHNFRKTHFDGAENLNGWHYRKKYGFTKTGCSGCHILCKQKGGDGRAIPEFETMSHFTALIGNRDIDLVMDASRFCNDAGIDSITAASAIACYMEIKNLQFADIDLMKMLNDIACSQGDGKLLRLGSQRLAESLGEPDASMNVKGLELPPYDPRGAYGMALSYVTSTHGGSHLRANTISHEILRKPVATDRFTFSGKARIIKLAEDMNGVADSLSVCRFMFFAASLEEYARAFHAVTGSPASFLLSAGERIYYNEKIMNYMRGFDSSDDILPERFFAEGGSSGDGIEIPPLDKEAFLNARGKYYRVRGLTPDGKPVKEKAIELGLQWTD